MEEQTTQYEPTKEVTAENDQPTSGEDSGNGGSQGDDSHGQGDSGDETDAK